VTARQRTSFAWSPGVATVEVLDRGSAGEEKVDDVPVSSPVKKPLEAAPRMIGHQLRVRVMEAKNIGMHLCTNGDNVRDPWTPHRLYVSVRSSTAMRRTGVEFVGFDVEFLRLPFGLTFAAYTRAGPSGTGYFALPTKSGQDFQLRVSAVDSQRVVKAVSPEQADLARAVLPNMVVAAINSVSLRGMSFADASDVLREQVGRGMPVLLRFITQDRKVRSRPLVSDMDGRRETDTEASKRSRSVHRVMQSCSVSFTEVLDFGDELQPQTAFYGDLKEPLPQFGPETKLRLCLYERNPLSSGSKSISVSEDALLGSGVSRVVLTVFAYVFVSRCSHRFSRYAW
jgi:hypothetical protein